MECLLDRSMRRGEPVLRVGYGHRGGDSTYTHTYSHIKVTERHEEKNHLNLSYNEPHLLDS